MANKQRPVANGSKGAVIMQTVQQEYSGIIPHPEIVRGYEELSPGSTDRILTMAEEQSKHRQEVEKAIVTAQIRDSFLGELFGFILSMSCLIIAVIVGISVKGNSGAILGSVLGVTGVGSVIATFITKTRIDKK